MTGSSRTSPGSGPGPGLGLGLALCWGLFVFDLALGGVAALWPEVYLRVIHPDVDPSQVELVRRTGMIWLAFAGVALRTATAAPAWRGHWFLVLAAVRFIDVPADLIYAATMSGGTTLSRSLVLIAVPLNLGLAVYFHRLSRRGISPSGAISS
jgi:hypothetical protein